MASRRALAPLAIAAGALLAGVAAASVPAAVGAATSVHDGRSATSNASATSSASAMPSPAAAEGEFLADINDLRTSRGLRALIVDPELTQQARIWASTMNDAGRIFHSGNLAGGISANWQKLGENVGVGGDVGSLFQAFVDSPSHYENLVDPAYTHVGVGVVVSADGTRMFTAHRFMGLMPPSPPAPPATDPAPVVRDTPAITAPPTTVPPTTAPPAAAPPPTTVAVAVADAPKPKLGPIDRIASLIASG